MKFPKTICYFIAGLVVGSQLTLWLSSFSMPMVVQNVLTGYVDTNTTTAYRSSVALTGKQEFATQMDSHCNSGIILNNFKAIEYI